MLKNGYAAASTGQGDALYQYSKNIVTETTLQGILNDRLVENVEW